MKKLLKKVLVFSLLAAMCVALAGCGDKDEGSSKKDDENKTKSIVGSRYFESGNYKETIEAVLDDEGYATKFIISMIPDDAEKIEDFKTLAENIVDGGNVTIDVKDDRVVIEMSAEEFYNEEGLTYGDNKASKDDIKELFEKNSFTVEE